jgi:hypothetical protein
MAKAVKSVVRALPQIAIAFAVTWATAGLSTAYWAAAAVAASAAVSGALMKTPRFGAVDRSSNISLASGSEPQNVVYGQARVRSLRVFAASAPGGGLANGYLHQVLALARTDEDGVEEIGDIYLGDEIVPLVPSGAGFVPEPGHRLQSALYIEKLTGAGGQSAPAALVAAGVGWTADHKLQGVAALYVRMLWDKKLGPDTWPDGLPPVTAVVKGQKVFDPRTGTKAWSDNFALCVRDFLRADYGYASDEDEVDDAAIVAAANLCDEQVPISLSGGEATQRRYTANVSLSLDGPPGDAVEQMLGAGMASLSYTRGAWRLYPAAYQAPAPGGLVLTADHLRGSPTIDMDPPRQDLANCVKGRFISPDQGWIATDFPTVEDDALIAADGERLEMDIELAPVTDPARAQRLAKIALRRSRRGTVQWPGNWRCLTLRVGDVVPVTLDAMGWTEKPFRIDSWELASEGGIDLLLREELASDYAWTTAEEQALPTPPRTNLPDPGVVSAPSSLTVVGQSTVLADGSVAPVLVVTIGGSPDADARDYLVRWRLATDTEWQVRLLPAGASVTMIEVRDGATYAVAAAVQNIRGVTSPWTATQLVEVTSGITGARVVRLELFGQGLDTTFEGRDVRLVWDGVFPDTAQAFGQEPFGAGTATANPYLSGYMIRVVDPDTGRVLRTEGPQVATEYTYSFDSNVKDGGPRRRLRFDVSMAPKVGGEVGTASLTVSNPAPGLPANVAITGETLGIRVAYRPTVDNDWRGAVVYAAPTLPVPIDAAHLIYRGPDTDKVLPFAAGTKLWVQLAQTDAFGEDSLTFTGPVEVTALAIVADDLGERIIGEDQLTEVLSGRIDLVDAPSSVAGSVASRIQAEAQARADALAAEALARGTAITNEATTRQNADSALASTISTVSAVANSAVAAIETEQTARINADGALASQITTLVTRVGNAESAITTEVSTRASGDSANASAISTLSAQVNNATTGLPAAHARITTEETTRATADTANASAISTLSAQVNNATTGLPAAHARITTEETTRATADTANANAISTLSAQVNNATTGLPAAHARITTEETTRATADTANANAISTLSAQVNNATTGLPAAHARITTEETARANAVSAVASSVSTLSTTVGNNTSAISTQQTSINGLSAQYTVKVDVNGKAAGFGLASTPINGATVSHFAVVADKFSVSLPGETANRYIFAAGTDPVTGTPTVLINGALYAGSITAAQLTSGVITATDIRMGATYIGAPGMYLRAADEGNTARQTLFFFDGTRRRVELYRNGSDAGINVWNAAGALILGANGLGLQVVSTGQIVPGSITNSAQSAPWSSGPSGLTVGDTTVASHTITHNGKKVRVEVTGGAVVITNASNTSADIDVSIVRDGSEIARWNSVVAKSGLDYLEDIGIAQGSLSTAYIDPSPPGSASTYSLILNRNGGQAINVANVRLIVTALLTE